MPSSYPEQSRSSRRPYAVVPPLTQAEDAAEGAAILQEFPGPLGTLLWGALRDVMLWTESAPAARAGLFAPQAAADRSGFIGRSVADEELRALLLELATLTEAATTVTPEHLASLAGRLARWAEALGAPHTRLAWVQAAALLRPGDARLALETGRLARDLGLPAQAETWLRRAIKLARNRDWATYVWSFMALGHLYWRAGNHPAALAVTQRALRRARRERLGELQAVILHNLFMFHSDWSVEKAYAYAWDALRTYGKGHPRLPVLAADVAYHWCDRQQFARALPGIEAALPWVDEPAERALGTASRARAAAGAGLRDQYEQARVEALRTLALPGGAARKAEVLLTLARADARAGEWQRAIESAETAVHLAKLGGESFVRLAAEAELELARRCASAGPAAEETRRIARQAEHLKESLLRCLSSVAGDRE